MTDPAVTNATVGAVVVDADTGEEIYARNPDAMLVPASNMKMLTTAAALATLGPDYQVCRRRCWRPAGRRARR